MNSLSHLCQCIILICLIPLHYSSNASRDSLENLCTMVYYNKMILLTAIGERGVCTWMQARSCKMWGKLINSLKLVCLGFLFSCFFITETIMLHGQDFVMISVFSSFLF